jgi:hypothetical protein
VEERDLKSMVCNRSTIAPYVSSFDSSWISFKDRDVSKEIFKSCRYVSFACWRKHVSTYSDIGGGRFCCGDALPFHCSYCLSSVWRTAGIFFHNLRTLLLCSVQSLNAQKQAVNACFLFLKLIGEQCLLVKRSEFIKPREMDCPRGVLSYVRYNVVVNSFLPEFCSVSATFVAVM